MINVAILGSTGSIGINALDVIRRFPGKFKVVALSTNAQTDILSRQIKEFKPLFAAVADKAAFGLLKAKTSSRRLKFFSGEDGIEDLVSEKRIDKILMAISGRAALEPLLAAIRSGKDIALANKEALVMAGPLIMRLAKRKKVEIIPVDSEQSAIWQCLRAEDASKVKNIYLTASGGPLRKTAGRDLSNISVKQVLRHPRWKMGKKITVDSATLMNKGLELLETMFLFGLEAEKIKIVIHPQSIVHSMVEFIDGVILAQLSATDMRIPIQYALAYPERLTNDLKGLDFFRLEALHFEEPDFKRFPCLSLALRAARQLGTLPAVLNAANEVSVNEFLREKLDFVSIPKVIESVMDRHRNIRRPHLPDILAADSWARKEAHRLIHNLN